jgi:putative ABC transport system ATP-binding protein
MTLIETQQVCRFFRAGTRDEIRAVEDVSLSIPGGEFVVLSGRSGSGKTTLLALLGALARPTSGKVLFEGRDLSGKSDVELARVRRGLGFVFQNFSLLPRLAVWENVTYGLVPRGVSRSHRYELARQGLERFGLGGRMGERPESLSGGEQQRVAVARALVSQPPVLLADEPTSNLDQRAGEDLIAILRELHAAGQTLIVATHDPALAALATRAFHIDRGRLVA